MERLTQVSRVKEDQSWGAPQTVTVSADSPTSVKPSPSAEATRGDDETIPRARGPVCTPVCLTEHYRGADDSFRWPCLPAVCALKALTR